MSNSSPNTPINRIMVEIGSPVVKSFMDLFVERITVAHRKMETAQGEDLYRLQGRCNELREIINELGRHRERPQFEGKHGSYF